MIRETDGDEAAFASDDDYGLNKREYFAAMAMQGLLSNPNKGGIKNLVKDSVQFADLLIEQLNKE